MDAHLAPASFFQYILARSPLISEVDAWLTTLSDCAASLLANCFVVSLQHRKDARMPEHEYLLATLSIKVSKDEIQIRYVRVERRSGGSGAFRCLGQGTLAANFISISASPFVITGSYSLYDLHFSETNRPTILDFAAMLDTIIFLDAKYRLCSSNCYWFAKMVFEGMAHTFSDSQVFEGEKPHRRGTFAKVPISGTSSAMKLWMKCISVFALEEVPGVDSKVVKRQNLVGGIYFHRRRLLHPAALKVEAELELGRVHVDRASSEPPFFSSVAPHA